MRRSRSRRSSRRAAVRRARSGSKLAVTAAGRLFGSVSGGCVEADVAERAKASRRRSRRRSSRTGSPTSEAWSVGLPCGGEIDVFVEPFDGRARRSSAARAMSSSPARVSGERWHDDFAGTPPGCAKRTTAHLRRSGRSAAAARRGRRRRHRRGAVRAREAARLAHVVVDPRPGLATRERVPSADEIIVAWPDEIESTPTPRSSRSCTRSGSTSRRCDAGVEGGAFYVGALGSRRAQEKRREKLGDARRPGPRPGRTRPGRRDTGGDRARDPRARCCRRAERARRP